MNHVIGRRSGKTTRAIDSAIQSLFKYGAIKVLPKEIKQKSGAKNFVAMVADHNPGMDASRNFYQAIVRRIKQEHPNVNLICEGDIIEITKYNHNKK